jgi:hypothetical protein
MSLSRGLVRLVREERVNTAQHQEQSSGNSPVASIGIVLIWASRAAGLSWRVLTGRSNVQF